MSPTAGRSEVPAEPEQGVQVRELEAPALQPDSQPVEVLLKLDHDQAVNDACVSDPISGNEKFQDAQTGCKSKVHLSCR